MGTMESGEELMWGNEERIYVSVRLRPLNSKEILRNDVSDWDCINDTTVVYKNASFSASDQRSLYPTVYTFDRVFGSNCSTREVYEQGAKEVALSVLNGINSSVFAYGQTSSGKTYTMTGITEFAIADIYDYIQKHTEREFVMKFSAMEIYNESVRDLLSLDSTPLRLLDDPEKGTVVEKLTEETLRDWSHIIELLSVCEAQRQIGETSLNEMSSRSHQIIRLTIESSTRGRDNISTLAATVNFIDLAGSERASQSLSAGTRLKEGCHINRSLLTLGTVIRKLSKGRNGHVPYRDSKLTRILQTSLGGNARTAIICTMSPARIHVEQSRNTLLFASCAKEVTTNAQVNVIMSDKALVKYLQRELERLESELRSTQASFDNSSDYSEILLEKDLQIKRLAEEINDISLQRDIAQSQVRDLLQMLKDDATCPTTPVGSVNYPDLHMQKSPDSENKEQELSISADHPRPLDVGTRTYSDEHSRTSSEDHFAKLHYFSKSYSFRAWEEIDKQSNEASEDQCREVRCIETQESSSKVATESHSLSSEETTGLIIPGDDQIAETPSTPLRNDSEMKEDKDSDKEFSSNNFLETPTSENLSPMHESDEDHPRSFKLSKSTSCKARIDDSWTPMSDIMDSSENLSERKIESPLNLSFSDIQSLSRKDSRRSSGNALDIEIDNPNVKFANAEDDVTSTNDVGEKTELSTELEFTKTLTEEIEGKGNESPMKNLKDVGLDPIEDEPKGLSSWPMEFNRFQQEIIELWHDCNVSLVHRTYFFMLFQGDPSDAIYLEVELRRLKFLKDKFSQEDKIFINGQHLTLASSAKALRGERQMLTGRMSKKLSEEERENLFIKWGIDLNSKFRKLQLAHRLWSKTENMDHVKESASLVAHLVRFSEPGRAPNKEMFGLNFTPRSSTRSYSFRRNLISSFM